MCKTVVIHQPDFMPYLGFFHRLLYADLFVILDNVQFVRGSNSWHCRDKIKTSNGEKWITISVEKCKQNTSINEVIISNKINWRENHLNQIITNYKDALFFKEIFEYINELYSFECEKMIDFNLKSIKMLMKLLNINIEIKLASSLDAKGKNNELLVSLIKEVKGQNYLSGLGAKEYYDPLVYENEGVNVIFQDFKHPVYPQLFGEFIPYLSSIDLLFNCGIEESRRILKEI